jgi:PqqD family protein of HPr-rel-A system
MTTPEPTGRPGYRPQRREGVLALDMGDGTILYNHDSSLVHHLSPSASVIWSILDGEAGPEQLATEIAEEYGVDPLEVSKQVTDLLKELDALGLIQDASGGGAREVASNSDARSAKEAMDG